MLVNKNTIVNKFNIKQSRDKVVQDAKTPFLRGKSLKQGKLNVNGKKVYINFKNIYKDALTNFQTNQKNM